MPCVVFAAVVFTALYVPSVPETPAIYETVEIPLPLIAVTKKYKSLSGVSPPATVPSTLTTSHLAYPDPALATVAVATPDAIVTLSVAVLSPAEVTTEALPV